MKIRMACQFLVDSMYVALYRFIGSVKANNYFIEFSVFRKLGPLMFVKWSLFSASHLVEPTVSNFL
jgi:hypothetical protein